MGFGVWGLGFGVWGLGFGVWGLGFGVWGLGFGVWGLGFGVRGLGFGVYPLRDCIGYLIPSCPTNQQQGEVERPTSTKKGVEIARVPHVGVWAAGFRM